MLDLLVKYSQEHGLASEPGFANKTIRWAAALDEAGRFMGLVEPGDAGRGRTFLRCPHLNPSELKSGEKYSQFLCDCIDVVLIHDVNAKHLTRRKHDCFVDFILTCGRTSRSVAPIAAFFQREEEIQALRRAVEAEQIKKTETITFVCDGRFPIEATDWNPWWRERRNLINRTAGASRQASNKTEMRCLITGELVSPNLTHDGIKGLRGEGKAAVSPLVSFDKDAFRSYGLLKGANAAVGADAEAAYRTALNHLVKTTGKHIGTSTIVHWFKDAVAPADDPLAFLVDDPPVVREASAQQLAAELLDAIRKGKRTELGLNRYYALTLSGSGGRVMVRAWMEGPFTELTERIVAWFDDLAIVAVNGNELAPSHGIRALAECCVRPRKRNSDAKDHDLSIRRISDRLLGPALRGEPISEVVAARVIARIRATSGSGSGRNGKSVMAHSPARIGILKAFILRKLRTKGGQTMADQIRPSLNPDIKAPEYWCGQLMAVLSVVQRRALGDVGAGVVQRYYAAASATPALVFGRLIRTSQFHLGKLQPGLRAWYEARISEVTDEIRGPMPNALDLEGQSLFALGYYHQLADLMRNKKAFDELEEEESDEESN